MTRLLLSICLVALSSLFTEAVPHYGARKSQPMVGKAPSMKCPGLPNTAQPSAMGAKAIYFLTNEEENSVVALKVGEDGTLSDGSITASGGAGANGIDGATNEPAASDPLFSQSALRVVGNMLFAVNAGSNTLSMMVIDEEDPTKLTLVGSPVDTCGEFPVSVTASLENSIACVANTGAKAGVACASFSAEEGLGAMDALRVFDINQSTPPVGPTNTVSQTFFNDRGTALLTTVKGDPMQNNTGFLSSFAVSGGVVSQEGTTSSPEGTAVLFGSAVIPGTDSVLVTDASFGSAILSLDAEGNADVVGRLAIDDQVATCWAAVSEKTGTGFVTDVAVNRIVEVDLNSGDLVQEFFPTNGNPGMIDLAIGANFVYALSPGNATVDTAVAVFDISGGPGSIKEVQNFNPKYVSSNVQGMTVIS